MKKKAFGNTESVRRVSNVDRAVLAGSECALPELLRVVKKAERGRDQRGNSVKKGKGVTPGRPKKLIEQVDTCINSRGHLAMHDAV